MFVEPEFLHIYNPHKEIIHSNLRDNEAISKLIIVFSSLFIEKQFQTISNKDQNSKNIQPLIKDN